MATSPPTQPRTANSVDVQVTRSLALLTDGVDGLTTADLLEHKAIADTFAAAIRGTPNREPLGIALYGPWGQGKSTIGRLLRFALKPEIDLRTMVFVKIDAWKYAHENSRLPLRRHFLLEAYSNAGFTMEARELREGFRRPATRKSLDQGRLRRLGRWGDRVAAALRLTWGRGLAVVASIVVVGTLVDLRTAGGWFVALAAGGLIPLASLLLVSLREALYVTTREDPSWTIEVFDDHLTWLLDNTDPEPNQNKLDENNDKRVERFVFLIDDLDRCPDGIVVEAVATLQAFFGRKRCAYIVAADEDQLRRAIRAEARSAAGGPWSGERAAFSESYLEKIFQVAAYVPRPPLFAIQRYAQEIAPQTRLSELSPDERDSILAYLIHPLVVSPRQVRVILNDFVLTWTLAESREAEPRTHLARGQFSRSRLLLAKLVVLRTHFPWFYEVLYAQPELLADWQTHVLDRGSTGEVPDNLTVVRNAARQAVEAMGPESEQLSNESVAGLSANLIQPLTEYLSITRATLPRDTGQLQEFMYLRSRREFADLIGEAGELYQLAIATGEDGAIERSVRADTSQIAPAIRAALTVVQDRNPVRSDAARRAVLGFVAAASRDEVRELGGISASALYEDADAAMATLTENPTGHGQLVPWMPAPVLAAHSRTTPLAPRDHLVELAQAAAHRDPNAWEVIVERVLKTGEVEGLLEAIVKIRRRTRTRVERLLPPTLGAIRPVLEAVTALVVDAKAIVSAVDADERLLTLSIDGETLDAYWPNSNIPEAMEGVEIVASWHVDYDGDNILDRVVLGDDRALDNQLPIVATTEERERAWRVLEELTHRVRRVTDAARRLSELPAFDWQLDQDAERCTRLARELALKDRHIEPTLADAVEASTTIDRFPTARVSGTCSSLELAEESLAPRLGGILARAIGAIGERVPEEACTELRSSIESAKTRIGADPFKTAAGNLSLPIDMNDLTPVLTYAVGPSDPALAAAILRRRVEEELGEIAADADPDELEAVLSKLGVLSDLAGRYTTAMRREVVQLPLDARSAAYCELVLSLREQVGALGQRVPPAVLRSAASFSAAGAELAVDHGLRRTSIDRNALEAILAGLAVTSPSPNARQRQRVRTLIERRTSVEPELEQLAYLVRQGPAGRRLAERLFEGDLLMALLAEAQATLRSSPDSARRLLAGVTGWTGERRRVRRAVAIAYMEILRSVKTESELEIVVSSLLGFFRSPTEVEQVRRLKESIRDAFRRVGRLKSPTLVAALEQAADQLGLQRPRETAFVDEIRKRAS